MQNQLRQIGSLELWTQQGIQGLFVGGELLHDRWGRPVPSNCNLSSQFPALRRIRIREYCFFMDLRSLDRITNALPALFGDNKALESCEVTFVDCNEHGTLWSIAFFSPKVISSSR